jgi:excisionase family DNA binding protein
MNGAQKYLRAGQIAIELGVSERTVRRWIADGNLDSIKVGGTRLVARETLERATCAPSSISQDQDESTI